MSFARKLRRKHQPHKPRKKQKIVYEGNDKYTKVTAKVKGAR